MMTPGATAGARQAPVVGKGVSLRAYVSAVTVFGQRGTTWCGTRVVRPETYHGEEWHFLVDLRREGRLCGGKPPDPLSLAPDISVPNATAILDPPVASSQDGQCRNATLDEESGGPQSCMPPGCVSRYPKRMQRASGSSPHWISSDILGDGRIWWDILGDLWRFRISLRYSHKDLLKKISK